MYGKNAVTELLKSGNSVDTLYLADSEDKSLGFIAALGRDVGAVIKTVHPQKLEKICGSNRHQGVAALTKLCEYCTLDDIFKAAEAAEESPFLLVLDAIEDPHNLGAIIRTALCAGAHGIVIPERRGCAVTAVVYRASAGACAHMRIARVVNLPAAIRDIKARGVFCYCADMQGELCYDCDLTGAAALIIGSEGKGVSRLVSELCDKTVRLPMTGPINSLNASVAAGVLLYEVVRQNRLKGVQGHA